MIVKAVADQIKSLPKSYRGYALTQDDQGKIDISPGKYYIVYATSSTQDRSRYFVYTDGNLVKSLWWMPSELYEIVDDTYPKGWVTNEFEGEKLISYPSLANWKVSEGIIDGEKSAIDKYLSEVRTDPTFPKLADINAYNKKFLEKVKADEYAKASNLAKERGWEFPQKPASNS